MLQHMSLPDFGNRFGRIAGLVLDLLLVAGGTSAARRAISITAGRLFSDS